MDNVVEMKNITKIFPGVVANDSVNFTLRKGEVHVLLGENGAGKTTLMNILYGLYTQTSGDIFLHGEKVDIKNPNVAIKHGIGMVHQHFMLVQPFTVTENIILGDEPMTGKIFVDINKARNNVKDISDKFGLEVNPDAKIANLSVGIQQRVEILKALYRGAEILILDEPTAVLTPQEIDELEEIINNLVKDGKSIILITHKLKEVMNMSDRITVIRRGKVIDTIATQGTDIDALAELMVGRKVDLHVDKKLKATGEVVLEVKDLKVADNRKIEAVKGVSFTVRTGEIFAIAGVDGNGQRELIEGITGLRPVKSGSVTFAGEDITKKNSRDIIELGMAHIPEDRQKRGLVMEHDLAENMILGYHYKEPFAKNRIMNYEKIHAHAKALIQEYDIRTPNENITAQSLSGGNQQKVILAREFHKDPILILAAQPTRGLDVGAIEFVHRKIVEARDNNKAVLLVSLELDEVLALADRIGVIYDGKIVGVLDAKDANERKLGAMMAGGKEFQ
ncbi:MAG: ABC transporter ATP-binding protein [Eubacteriaceae bacterium]|nr:ABC transporter ATP-binding protein [Eubacteriaceae bacterium]